MTERIRCVASQFTKTGLWNQERVGPWPLWVWVKPSLLPPATFPTTPQWPQCCFTANRAGLPSGTWAFCSFSRSSEISQWCTSIIVFCFNHLTGYGLLLVYWDTVSGVVRCGEELAFCNLHINSPCFGRLVFLGWDLHKCFSPFLTRLGETEGWRK